MKKDLERITAQIESIRWEIAEGNTDHEVYAKLHHYQAQYHNLMQNYHRKRYFEDIKRGKK
jgi:hypothetical protein